MDHSSGFRIAAAQDGIQLLLADVLDSLVAERILTRATQSLAEILDAQQALAAGLVREVVAPDDLLPTAYALAHRFVDGRSPVATALMRQMLYRNSAQPDPLAAHQVESLAMFYSSIGDGKEGVAAFLGKRPADFTGTVPEDLPPFYPW